MKKATNYEEIIEQGMSAIDRYWKKTKDEDFLVELWLVQPTAFTGSMEQRYFKVSKDRQKYYFPSLAKAIAKDPTVLDRLDKFTQANASTLGLIESNFEAFTGELLSEDLKELLQLTIEQRQLEEVARATKRQAEANNKKREIQHPSQPEQRRREVPQYVNNDGRITNGITPDTVRKL
ncbi:MAG: hypothetical protein E7375_03340 [Clostridiales bacterium]|nr:hypothetical protein [Clostridiales bacterium]